MTVAQTVSVERRSVFLERVGVMLRMRGYGHFTDSDVSDVARLALCGLCTPMRPKKPRVCVHRCVHRRFFEPVPKSKKCKKCLNYNGEPGWDRTIDHLIKRYVSDHFILLPTIT